MRFWNPKSASNSAHSPLRGQGDPPCAALHLCCHSAPLVLWESSTTTTPLGSRCGRNRVWQIHPQQQAYAVRVQPGGRALGRERRDRQSSVQLHSISPSRIKACSWNRKLSRNLLAESEHAQPIRADPTLLQETCQRRCKNGSSANLVQLTAAGRPG